MKNKAAIYDDGRIACDDEGIIIRWYYLWGAKRIPFRAIRSAKRILLKPIRGKWRVWGSGNFVHWYNLNSSRPDKKVLARRSMRAKAGRVHIAEHVAP